MIILFKNKTMDIDIAYKCMFLCTFNPFKLMFPIQFFSCNMFWKIKLRVEYFFDETGYPRTEIMSLNKKMKLSPYPWQCF